MIGGPPCHMMWSPMYNPDRPTVKRKADWGRIGAFFRPYWRQLALILACIVAVSLIGLLPPLFTKWLIDDAIPQRSMRSVSWNVGGMVVSALVGGAIGVYQGYLNSLVGEGIMRDIRTSLVAHLHRMPLVLLHRHQDRRDHEPRLERRRQHRQRRHRDAGHDRHQHRDDADDRRRRSSSSTGAWRWSRWSIIPFMILPLSPVGRRMYQIRKAHPRRSATRSARSPKRRSRSPGSR